MARKGKKRRQVRQGRGDAPEAGPQARPAVAEEPVQARPAARKPARARKRAQKAGYVQIGPIEAPVRTLAGWGGALLAVGAVVVVVVLVATSGSSGVTAPQVTEPPDPRVAGLTPDATLEMEAGGAQADAYFSPSTLNGKAGDVIEIVVTNVGSLSHNVTVAGVDGQYDTSDDWVSRPKLFSPDEQAKVLLKIDEPGTYKFRCSLHPQVQFGQLVLQ